jgi:CubicO group peptidase (beta-lactamase class C family)
MSSIIIAALFQMMIVLPNRAGAQETKTVNLNDPKELEAFLDPIFAEQMQQQRIPGAAIAVVKDGKIFFSKGYGFADLDKKTPVVADKTIFRIGSITKVFTATALVQLAERQKIDLSDDVNKYLKDFKIRDTYPQPVTFVNLLTHTAGFDEINTGRKTTGADKVLPLGEFLKNRLVRRKPPGEFISYSTYGMSLAGLLVETISGGSLKEYLSRNIFEPLEMNRTSLGAVPANLQSDLATGYGYSFGDYHSMGFEYFHTFPASDINGTVTDMANFMMAHVDDGRFGNGRILSEQAARDMHRQHFTNHPKLIGFTYGFFENRRNGVAAVEHAGMMDGFSALMYLSPDKKFGIFIACNRETGGLQDWIKAAVLNRYFPAGKKPEIIQPPPPAENLDRFAGKYRADIYCHTCKEGERGYLPEAFEIKANKNGTISFWGGEWRQIEPMLFRLTGGLLDNGEAVVAFRQNRNGQITHMFNGSWSHEKLADEQPAQIKKANVSLQVLKSYVGEYQIAPNQLITITLDGGKLMGAMPGQEKVELSPVSETRFVVEEANAEVRFFKNGQGQITHLILNLKGRETRAERIKQ